MEENKRFLYRSIACFFLIMLMFLSCFLRVAVIANGDYGTLCENQIEYTIEVSKRRGSIYDCNMLPLTNTNQKLIAAILPVDTAIAILPEILSGDELVSVKKLLSEGKPQVCEVQKEIECEGISYTRIYDVSSGENTANHIIGYLDEKSHGLSGIQGAYDDILYCKEGVQAVFQTAGDASLLKGVAPRFKNDSTGGKNAVVTTIDASIQSAAFNVAQGLNRGAVVVCEASSGKIRAMVSRPDFDTDDIAAALLSTDSPLVNRALSAFSVGSVFKPCVAAAALEGNEADFIYNCTGSAFIVDRNFKCHNLSGHSSVDLKNALVQSCNTFFYNFALNIGGEAIYNMASSLNFGNRLNIGRNIKTAKGNLTRLSSLLNFANLANLSIGQGELSLSPVSILTLYCAVANGGYYYVPSIIEKTIVDGVEELYDKGSKTKAFSKKTAQTIKEALIGVVEYGTELLQNQRRPPLPERPLLPRPDSMTKRVLRLQTVGFADFSLRKIQNM